MTVRNIPVNITIRLFDGQIVEQYRGHLILTQRFRLIYLINIYIVCLTCRINFSTPCRYNAKFFIVVLKGPCVGVIVHVEENKQ